MEEYDSSQIKNLTNQEKRALLKQLIEERNIPVKKYLLSFSQERLWFLDHLDPGTSIYTIHLAVKISGDLNIEAFQKSIDHITERHEVLRTTFKVIDDIPYQFVSGKNKIALEYDDDPVFSNTYNLQIDKIISKEVEKPFNLSEGPLCRLKLKKIGDDEYIFINSMHHIITDGWSMGIFFRELSQLYNSFVNNETNPLKPLKMQYGEYSEQQRIKLNTKYYNELITFWKNALKGAPSLLNLPTKTERPLIQSKNANKIYFQFNVNYEDLLKYCKNIGSTLYMSVFSAFSLLIYRYSNQDEFIIGTPVFNRNTNEVEDLIGFFTNTLPIRFTIDPTDKFTGHVLKIKDSVINAYDHQELPFRKLVEVIQPERNLSYNPIVQVAFAFHNDEQKDLNLHNLSTEFIQTSRYEIKMDMAFHVWEENKQLKGFIIYNSDLFNHDWIESIPNHFETILNYIIRHNDVKLCEIPIISENEQQELIYEWNNTDKAYDNMCIHKLFEKKISGFENKIAVKFYEKEITYSELNNLSNQLAHYLIFNGITPESAVGIYLNRSVEMIISILGIIKSGGAYVPLDPAYPDERIKFIVEDSEIDTIITSDELESELNKESVKIINIDKNRDDIKKCNTSNIDIDINLTNLAYIIYTSGSTGNPKGVLIEHKGLLNLVYTQTESFQITNESRILQFASICFDASVSEIFTALISGSCLILTNKEDLQPGIPLLNLLKREKITTVTLPPSVLSVMSYEELPDLKTLVVAGEECPVNIINIWAKDRLFINAYGPTEGTVCATLTECHENDSLVSIGRPINNMKIFILDEYLHPVPVGVEGEIYISGIGLARGYLKHPELTKDKFFITDKLTGEKIRMYKTGDRAKYLNDGRIIYRGRNDEQIKLRGYRIEIQEIVYHINHYPGVKQSLVVYFNDDKKNEQLVAYIILEKKNNLLNNEIKNYLYQKLPSYMIPSAYIFLDHFPVTQNGKIDKKALPKPGITDFIRKEGNNSTLPTNPTEKIVTESWQKALNLENIGIDDNFFDIGGHSLLIPLVIQDIEKSIQKKIDVIDFFKYPTINLISKKIDSDGSSFYTPDKINDRVKARKEAILKNIKIRKK